MRTEIKSLLDARGFAVEVVTEAGHIMGASLDMAKVEEIVESFTKDLGLPETSKEDTLQSISSVRAFAFEQLARLKEVSGITITAANAEAIAQYIIGGATLPSVTPNA